MIIKVYRYQSVIQKLYIREGQTMQWEKKKDKGTNNDIHMITQKTKYLA